MAELSRICVFLGSSTGTNPALVEATKALADELVKRELTLVYGGGAVGLMGLLADTVLDGGGEVIGVIPRNLFSREVAHRGLTELIETDSMHERKAIMYEQSDAFVALPGGMGTLDELAEITTWRQIGLHTKPVGLLDADGYFTHLIAFLDRAVTDGLLNDQNRGLLHHHDSAAALLDTFAAETPKAAAEKWDSN